ncbi:MAG TPA: MlaD family protein [Gemmatimonadaceae bacterium]|nr:MlaD family protein [Gemmatimonadaceae bacterium]
MSPRLLATLVAAVAIAATAMFLMVPRRPAQRTVVAVFPAAPELREGTRVTYLGVEAGTVTRIALEPRRVMATLSIARPDVVLHVGDSVRLRTMGFFGDQVVDIVPIGRPESPLLSDRDSLFGPAGPEQRIPPMEVFDAIIREAGRIAKRDSAARAAQATAAAPKSP